MLDDATAPHAAEYRAKGFAGTPRDFGGTPLHLYIYVADADAHSSARWIPVRRS